MALDAFLAFAHRFKVHAGLLVLVGLADLAGIVFGYYYYANVGQFAFGDLACTTGAAYCQPVWLWPLVADSPNAVLVFFVAALLYRFVGWRSHALDAVAFTLNVYVGLWTTLLFLSYPDAMGTFELGSTNNILFVTHMGMPLQALVLARDMRASPWPRWLIPAVLGFLAVFVFVDYWGPHLHPAPFLHTADGDAVIHASGDNWLAVASPVLMVAAAASWLLLCRPAPKAISAEA